MAAIRLVRHLMTPRRSDSVRAVVPGAPRARGGALTREPGADPMSRRPRDRSRGGPAISSSAAGADHHQTPAPTLYPGGTRFLDQLPQTLSP